MFQVSKFFVTVVTLIRVFLLTCLDSGNYISTVSATLNTSDDSEENTTSTILTTTTSLPPTIIGSRNVGMGYNNTTTTTIVPNFNLTNNITNHSSTTNNTTSGNSDHDTTSTCVPPLFSHQVQNNSQESPSDDKNEGYVYAFFILLILTIFIIIPYQLYVIRELQLRVGDEPWESLFVTQIWGRCCPCLYCGCCKRRFRVSGGGGGGGHRNSRLGGYAGGPGGANYDGSNYHGHQNNYGGNNNSPTNYVGRSSSGYHSPSGPGGHGYHVNNNDSSSNTRGMIVGLGTPSSPTNTNAITPQLPEFGRRVNGGQDYNPYGAASGNAGNSNRNPSSTYNVVGRPSTGATANNVVAGLNSHSRTPQSNTSYPQNSGQTQNGTGVFQGYVYDK